MTFNTGNNVPSTSPRDLYDNAENMDQLMNGPLPFYADRTGKLRDSWAGMENGFVSAQESRESRFDAHLAATGYQFVGDYAAGITLTERSQLVRNGGEYWRLSASATLPYVTTGAGMPESGSFVSVGDAVLRQELAGPDGATLVSFSGADGEVGSLADLAEDGGGSKIGWRRSALSGAVHSVGQMLDAQPVSVWEFQHLITARGEENAPSTWDWTPAIQAAINAAYGSVTIPAGEYRIDGTIVVNERTTVYNFGALKRKAAYSASTEPVLNVRGSRAAFIGGDIATENNHPKGVVRLGHDSITANYTTTKWRFADCYVRGNASVGGIGVSIVCAQASDVNNGAANYFGHCSNLLISNTFVGLQCEEYANGHNFDNILFWDCENVAFAFYGAYGNCVQGGFVHTGGPNITGVILGNSRLPGSVHHSDGNYILGLGIEPGGAGAFGFRIGSLCERNVLQLSPNVAAGNLIENTNNTVQNAFGKSYFQSGVLHSTAKMEITQSVQSDRHIEKYGSIQNLPENTSHQIAEIEVPTRTAMIVKIDLCLNAPEIGIVCGASYVYSLQRNDGAITAVQLSGGKHGDGADVSWNVSGNPARLNLTTFNNGSATTFGASWVLSVQAPATLPSVS